MQISYYRSLHNGLLTIPDLNDLDFRVLSYLTFCSKTGSFQAYPKVGTIAEKCQCSVNTVKRSLKRLLDRNLIEKVSRKGGGAVVYQFSFLDKPIAKIIDIHTKRQFIDDLPDDLFYDSKEHQAR